MKKGKSYEELIAKIYKELSPEAEVISNDRIKGRDTGAMREIDVSIRSNIAGHDILIAIQAKDYKRPADINIVGVFKGVIQDIGASKGILICSKGFTKRALEYGKNVAIDLCTVHDAESRDWKLDLKLPVLVVKFLEALTYKTRVGITEELRKVYENETMDMPKIDVALSFDKGKTISTIQYEIELYKDRVRSSSPDGKYSEDLCLPGLEVKMQNVYAPLLEFTVNYAFSKTCYLKYFDTNGYRGIKNNITGKFNPSFMSTEGIEVPIVNFDSSWEQVNPDEIAITPFTLTLEIVDHMQADNFKYFTKEIKKVVQ